MHLLTVDWKCSLRLNSRLTEATDRTANNFHCVLKQKFTSSNSKSLEIRQLFRNSCLSPSLVNGKKIGAYPK